jgi:alcohol dehydrogenase YqhD (iron-dependent ADH family)
MLGNFDYHNPTKLYFGEDALDGLKTELAAYGPVVMLSYGGGSIKRNGIYDKVVALLHESGKTIVEDGGVMANPTVEKLYEVWSWCGKQCRPHPGRGRWLYHRLAKGVAASAMPRATPGSGST